MNLKDIIAKITGLEARAEAAFKSELTDLKNVITGQLTDLTTKYNLAVESIDKIRTSLATALTNAKISFEASASPVDLVTSLVSKLTSTETLRAGLELEITNFKTALTDACLAANLLELKGEDGKPLAADATPEAKAKAAAVIPIATKFSLYQGALNAAFAKAGISNSTLPKAPEAPIGQQANSMKRVAYFQMSAQAQLEFVNRGGKIID